VHYFKIVTGYFKIRRCTVCFFYAFPKDLPRVYYRRTRIIHSKKMEMTNLKGFKKLSRQEQKLVTGGSTKAGCPKRCISLYISDADGNCFNPTTGFVGVECGGRCCRYL
jgi:hypothetical protein